MNGDSTADKLRRLVDGALLRGHLNSVHNLFEDVYSKASSARIEFDGAVVLEYFWSLARIGAVAVPGGGSPSIRMFEMPQILLTARGRELLEKGECSPHNPSKYLAAVRRRVTEADDVALSYLAEAVEAWRCGLNRSSAVMVGCACERLVLLLGEAISANEALPETQEVRKELGGRVFVSALFDTIRSTLTALRNQRKLPKELGDALDRKLSAIFDHARGLRNKSGHPTGEQVSADEAQAGLLLFPGFYELVDKIVRELRKTAANGMKSSDKCS